MTNEPVAAEPSGLRLALTLALAGLLSGLALVATYKLTKPYIDANRARARRRAVFKVVPGAKAMQKLVQRDGVWTVAKNTDTSAGVYGGYDQNGRLIGYAISAEGPGFQDTIGILYGFDPTRRVITGMEVLKSSETPGLGDKIFKDAAFAKNFKQLAVEPEVAVVKHGTKTKPHQIDAITGATISSKAIGKIIRNANKTWLAKLPAAADAPPLAKAKEGKAK